LIDETMKEGYIFDPLDLINPAITHEKPFLIFLSMDKIVGLKNWSIAMI